MSRHDLAAYLLKRWLPVFLGIVLVVALIYLLRDCMFVPASLVHIVVRDRFVA
jgi:hypothetical protein